MNPLKKYTILFADDDVEYNKTFSNNKDIKLSNAESIVLEQLLLKKGTLITLEEFESLFSNNEQSITSLRNIIYKLRQKLPKEIIKNFAKIGYLIK